MNPNDRFKDVPHGDMDISIRIRVTAEQKKRLEDMAYDARRQWHETG